MSLAAFADGPPSGPKALRRQVQQTENPAQPGKTPAADAFETERKVQALLLPGAPASRWNPILLPGSARTLLKLDNQGR